MKSRVAMWKPVRSDENLNPKNKLNNYLTNIELWPINYAEDEIIEDEINKIFGKEEIELAQAEKLYEYLGGDISKLEELIKKYEKKEKKESNNKDIKKKYNRIENYNIIIENKDEDEINKNMIKNEINLMNDEKDEEEENNDNKQKKEEEKEDEEDNNDQYHEEEEEQEELEGLSY